MRASEQCECGGSMVLWCADCAPQSLSEQIAESTEVFCVCARCGHIEGVPIRDGDCPNRDRHSCCEVGLEGAWREGLQGYCARCDTRICVCGRVEAVSCSSSL